MGAHVKVGINYTSVNQLLLYSFGMNNHEFVVSYETDSLEDFQNLVMELRSTEGRRYTENDLPVSVCIVRPAQETLDLI